MSAAVPSSVYRRNLSRRVTGTSSAVSLLLGSLFVLADEPIATLSEGLFSAEQAERGEQSFLAECMECHELPEFTAADAFFDEKNGETVWSVFEFIWSEMPEDRPAWLDPEEYADILAYLLRAYGFPSGPNDMPMDQTSLEQVTIEPPPRAGS